MVKAIVTVIGVDKVGIIARVSNLLWQQNVNILDISQTVMNEYFTMVMLCDVGACSVPFGELREQLSKLGEDMGLSVRIQHQDIFNAMHAVG